jgi:hypothetical protein
VHDLADMGKKKREGRRGQGRVSITWLQAKRGGAMPGIESAEYR